MSLALVAVHISNSWLDDNLINVHQLHCIGTVQTVPIALKKQDF